LSALWLKGRICCFCSSMPNFISRLWFLAHVCVTGPLLLCSFLWIGWGGEVPFVQEDTIPLMSFSDWGVAGKLGFNALLIMAFGACHSFLAQKFSQDMLLRVVPIQLLRPLFVLQSALWFVFIILMWQPFPQVIWTFPYLGRDWSIATSAFIVVPIDMGISFLSPLLRNQFELLGFTQILMSDEELHHSAEISQNAELLTTGIYSVVRHPVYLAVLSSQLFALHMSMNRIVMVALFVLYLSFGVPIEERKLINIWGDEYVQYQSRFQPSFLESLMLLHSSRTQPSQRLK